MLHPAHRAKHIRILAVPAIDMVGYRLIRAAARLAARDTKKTRDVAREERLDDRSGATGDADKDFDARVVLVATEPERRCGGVTLTR